MNNESCLLEVQTKTFNLACESLNLSVQRQKNKTTATSAKCRSGHDSLKLDEYKWNHPEGQRLSPVYSLLNTINSFPLKTQKNSISNHSNAEIQVSFLASWCRLHKMREHILKVFVTAYFSFSWVYFNYRTRIWGGLIVLKTFIERWLVCVHCSLQWGSQWNQSSSASHCSLLSTEEITSVPCPHLFWT